LGVRPVGFARASAAYHESMLNLPWVASVCQWIRTFGRTTIRPVTTKAWLEGHDFDLQDLAQLFATGDVRVVHDADQSAYYLTAPEIDNPPDGTTYYEAAQRLLPHINGMGRVNKADFRPVQLTGTYTTPTGQDAVVVAAAMEGRARMDVGATVIGPDGHPKPDPPSPWPARLALAGTNPEVAKVLTLMGGGEKLDWYSLFKVYELVDNAIGGEEQMRQNGWATSTQQRAFRASANLEKVSGDAARHAVDPGTDHPKKTMTIEQGRSFISELVREWFQTL
jgi:hypothetical protein